MFRNKFILMLVLSLFTMGFTACSDDDDVTVPKFGAIEISPSQDVYHVGDVVTLSITRKTAGSNSLKEASYWWYASWWFSNPDMKADFQEFDSNDECRSSQITLTKAGEVKLYFFGRLEYPNFDWRKIELSRTITVVE